MNCLATLVNEDGEFMYQFEAEETLPYFVMMHGLDGQDYAGTFHSLDHVPSEDLSMMIVYETITSVVDDFDIKDTLYVATRIVDFVDEEDE